VAIDSSGNAWFADDASGAPGISKFSNTGTAISGYSGGGATYPGPTAIAVDASNNVWSASSAGIAKFSNTGTAISPSVGYGGGGLSNSTGMAIDGAGNVWVSDQSSGGVSEWSSAGTAISPSTSYRASQLDAPQLTNPKNVAIDGSGDVWVTTSAKKLFEYIGAAAPVVTPLAVGVKNNTIATRP
jgi:hypothetical protein